MPNGKVGILEAVYIPIPQIMHVNVNYAPVTLSYF